MTCRFDPEPMNLISFESNSKSRVRSPRALVSATLVMAFSISLYIDVGAKPHQFPLAELDWHFGNPSAQEMFKSSQSEG